MLANGILIINKIISDILVKAIKYAHCYEIEEAIQHVRLAETFGTTVPVLEQTDFYNHEEHIPDGLPSQKIKYSIDRAKSAIKFAVSRELVGIVDHFEIYIVLFLSNNISDDMHISKLNSYKLSENRSLLSHFPDQTIPISFFDVSDDYFPNNVVLKINEIYRCYIANGVGDFKPKEFSNSLLILKWANIIIYDDTMARAVKDTSDESKRAFCDIVKDTLIDIFKV
jgi:hypothetical protein